MNKHIVMIGVFCLMVSVFFSGCEENKTTAIEFEDVVLISSVVELVNASLDLIEDADQIVFRAEVRYLFHNIAQRDIETLKITAEFLDINGTLLNSSRPKFIYSLYEDYVERGYSPHANIIVFEDPLAAKVDSVRLIAVEESS